MALSSALFLALGCSFDSRGTADAQREVDTPVKPGPSTSGSGQSTAGTQAPPLGAAGTSHVPDDAGMQASDAGRPRSPSPVDASEATDAAMDPLGPTPTNDPDAAAPSDASDEADAAPLPPLPPPVDAGPPAPVCPVGRYVGNFSCAMDPTGLTPLFVTTDVELGLVAASPRSALVIANAPIAFELTGVLFTGELAGELDCVSGVLRAEIVNGSFTPVLIPLSTPFTGSLDGTIDRAIPRLTGSWEFSAFDGVTCLGEWQATLRP